MLISKVKKVKVLFRRNKIWLWISMFIFSVTLIVNLMMLRIPHMLSLEISTIPFIHFLIRYIRQNKYHKKVIGTNNMFGMLYVGGYLYCLILLAISDSTRPISDIRYYEKCINYYRSSCHDIYTFLPEHIPRDANECFFFDMPKYLQGAQITLLGYKTNDEEIKKYIDENKKKAIFIRPYKEALAGEYVVPNFVRLEVKGEVSEYKVMMLVYDDDWNHPQYQGIIVNEKRGEVIFYILAG